MANKTTNAIEWIKAEIAILELKRARRGLYPYEKAQLEKYYKHLQLPLPFEKEGEKK